MKLSEARKRYKDEWMAFRIQKKGADPVGEVVLHDQSRSDFEAELRAKKITAVYLTFNGEAIPEGYIAMF